MASAVAALKLGESKCMAGVKDGAFPQRSSWSGQSGRRERQTALLTCFLLFLAGDRPFHGNFEAQAVFFSYEVRLLLRNESRCEQRLIQHQAPLEVELKGWDKTRMMIYRECRIRTTAMMSIRQRAVKTC